jgi:hypothetical protein
MGAGKGNENIPWIYRGIDFQTLGKQIKKYRVLRGLRQSDLAELIFSTTNTISRIEIGGIGCSLENLLRIADALEVSPDALLFGNFNPVYSRFYPYFWDMKEEILRKMEENLSEIFKEISTKEQLTFVERDFQKWLKMTKQSREEMEAQAKEQSGEELRYSVEDYLFSATKVADPEEKAVEETPKEKKTKAQLRKEEKARQRESARKEKQLTQEEQRQRVRKEAVRKKK